MKPKTKKEVEAFLKGFEQGYNVWRNNESRESLVVHPHPTPEMKRAWMLLNFSTGFPINFDEK